MPSGVAGTGRIARLRMRPMTLWESGDSNGGVSLAQLFEQSEKIGAISNKTLEDIAFLTCRGGWPRAVSQKPKIALGRAKLTIQTV